MGVHILLGMNAIAAPSTTLRSNRTISSHFRLALFRSFGPLTVPNVWLCVPGIECSTEEVGPAAISVVCMTRLASRVRIGFSGVKTCYQELAPSSFVLGLARLDRLRIRTAPTQNTFQAMISHRKSALAR
jgi:hypothetical protein